MTIIIYLRRTVHKFYGIFFFFKQKTAYEIGVRLVGSEMCIRDSMSTGFAITYGSLATLVFIMLWLYACMNVLFIGAEINAHFQGIR